MERGKKECRKAGSQGHGGSGSLNKKKRSGREAEVDKPGKRSRGGVMDGGKGDEDDDGEEEDEDDASDSDEDLDSIFDKAKQKKKEKAASSAAAADPKAKAKVSASSFKPSLASVAAEKSAVAVMGQTRPAAPGLDDVAAGKFGSQAPSVHRWTSEGLPVYKYFHLGMKQEDGGTPLCPFDCKCCF